CWPSSLMISYQKPLNSVVLQAHCSGCLLVLALWCCSIGYCPNRPHPGTKRTANPLDFCALASCSASVLLSTTYPKVSPLVLAIWHRKTSVWDSPSSLPCTIFPKAWLWQGQ